MKQIIQKCKNFRVSTFEEYKEMNDFIMSLNLNDEDSLTIQDDDYDFTYGINVKWYGEESDEEYQERLEYEKKLKYQELKEEEKNKKLQKQLEHERELKERGEYIYLKEAEKRKKFQQVGLINYNDYMKEIYNKF